MEEVGDAEEADDEEELEADAAHVNVQTPFDLVVCEIVSGSHGCTDRLDEEGDNVQEDKVQTEAPGLDAENPSRGSEVVYHPADDHVDKGIDPERGEEDQDEPSRVQGGTLIALNAQDSCNVGTCLPRSAHDNHPCVEFTVENGLSDVGCRCEAEENSEKVGSTDGGT